MRIEIRSPITGRVDTINARLNQKVTKGDMLAIVKPIIEEPIA